MMFGIFHNTPKKAYAEAMSVTSTARVLIVDRSHESRDVLRSLLTRQGAEVLEARLEHPFDVAAGSAYCRCDFA